MDPVCAFHCGISHFIIVFVSCVYCGRFRNRLCWYFNEITWVWWSRSLDCAAQLPYCVYRATALDMYIYVIERVNYCEGTVDDMNVHICFRTYLRCCLIHTCTSTSHCNRVIL